MVDKAENNEKSQNYVELTEGKIFEKIKEDLNPIKEALIKERMTIKDAKDELKKINEWIQRTKLEDKDKKNLGDAFNRLTNNLEKNIDKNNSETEFNEVLKLLEKLTKKDLANLKQGIQQNKQRWNPERTPEVQEGIDVASDNLNQTIDDALNDSNGFIRKYIGPALKHLNS